MTDNKGMARYRNHSEDEKATAMAFLAANSGNYKSTSKQTGIPWQTIQSWDKGVGVNTVITEKSALKRTDLADHLDEKIEMLVNCISADRIADANLVQITTALGTLIDKSAALRKPQAMTREDLAEQQEQIKTIIKRYVSDPDTLQAIGDDFDRLSAGNSGEPGTG